jgi:hypothetical protein
MTPLECLRLNGAMEAKDVAREVILPIEDVYVELVAAESRGDAWVEVSTVPCPPWSIRKWVAL